MSHKHTLEIDYLSVEGSKSDKPPVYIVKELFDDNENNWKISDDEHAKTSLSNGKFIFQHKKEDNSYFSWNHFDLSDDEPFTIETTLKHKAGQTNFAYGLIWGIIDVKNFFTFNISETGYYRISRNKDSSWTDYVGWTHSNYINTNGESNELSIKKIDNKLKFYINDNFVNQIDFEEFFANGIGFVIWGQQTIEIEDLMIDGFKEEFKIDMEDFEDVFDYWW